MMGKDRMQILQFQNLNTDSTHSAKYTFSNMLQTSAPSGQENMAPTVYRLAIVNAIFLAALLPVCKSPGI